MSEYLWTDAEWSFPMLERVYTEIQRIGIDELGLDPYRAQIEIISSEQMIDAYSSIGLPIYYKHWSFGKHFSRDWDLYKHGYQSLAYEIVINSDPCIIYCMEENTATMQALVLAHAGIAHSHFFKNNYLFKEWTDAASIMDYLIFARDYLAKCEAREGEKTVAAFLDSCHALQNYGVNPFKKPRKLSVAKEKIKQDEREAYNTSRVSDLYDSLIKASKTKSEASKFPKEPEENILWFCEKFAPNLKEWQREVIRIVRKLAQYFFPQGQTRLMNEGCLVEGSLIATRDGLIPIEQLVRERMATAVWDGTAWRRVYDWFENPPKKRIKITTHHGYEIHGGAEHNILINGVWTPLADIAIGDELPLIGTGAASSENYVSGDTVETSKVVTIEEDFGVTFDFSVEETHCYTSGPFIHHNCATYSHYRIMHRLHDLGKMTDGAMLEFLQSHTNVTNQRMFDEAGYNGINPYALGFAICRDIERICWEPTEEDRAWFPDFAGCEDEMTVLKECWANYRDESFIRQFLSPKVIRDFRLFRLSDNRAEPTFVVTAIHDKRGYVEVRESLANQYERHASVPQLEITAVDPQTRMLTVCYTSYRGRILDNARVMAHHLHTLWGYGVTLQADTTTIVGA
jgi:spore cortex formation protein SpoVR/YcgB (stage V sporulation)